MKPRLIVKKTHTSHINRLRVMLPTKDSDPGEVIVLAEQKRFVRVETTLCYSNEQREKVAFAIRFLEIPVENVRFSNLSLLMKCS